MQYVDVIFGDKKRSNSSSNLNYYHVNRLCNLE